MTQLDTQWIVGFVDGEGCFNLDVHIKEDMKWGIQLQPEFTVVQIEHDVQILHALKAHFGCGSVALNRRDATSTRMHYRCKSVKNLKEKILPFFENHKLKTKKGVEFQRFRDIVNLMDAQYHNKSLKNFLEIVDKGAALRVRVSTPNPKKPSKRTKVDEQLDKLRAMLIADPTL